MAPFISLTPKRITSLLLTGALSWLLAGCALLGVRQEVKESLGSTILVGNVQAPPGTGPIIVVAYSISQGKREIAHYTVLHDAGEFELMVGKGNYRIFAYRDKDSDLVYDADEPAGEFAGMVSAPEGGVVQAIDIVISEQGHPDLPDGFEIAKDKPRKLYSRQAGAILNLQDDLFREENGGKGFWEPVTFFKEIGGNIYFLEKYDPTKIPILFIHGATGTPKGWQYFVDHIDRTRFQPWFFYYPSGARISSMSYLLFWKLFNLQTQYGFTELYITAHSMGGLVARSFIMDYGKFFPYTKLLVTLATPWGGDKMAEYGVKQSPGVIPCWIDMQPESEFIRSLYREKLPEEIGFYLFYGYKGSRNPFTSNNDGTIVLSSLLDHRPQSEAKMNLAFDEDHASIVLSKEVVDQYNTILNAADASSSRAKTGGYLHLRIAYPDSADGPHPWPSLILRSVGQPGADTTISLAPEDTDKVLGPFPPGNYAASILAISEKPDRHSVPITIETGAATELNFKFSPEGMIFGQIATTPRPGDHPAGMPASTYGLERGKVDPESVELSGPGVHRMLRPLGKEEVDYLDLAIARKDFYTHGYFYFFDLPAGDYSVTIRARGYHPITQKHTVTPGRTKEFRATELTPETK